MTNLAELLQQQLDEALQEPGTANAAAGAPMTVSSEDLERLWSDLMPDTYAGRRGLDVFLQAVQAAADETPDADLQFRPGGWQVDLRRGTVQSVIAAALIAGLLVALGATAIPAAVVTAVVPLFFDIKRVALTPGQQYLLAELVGHKEALDGTCTPRELYDQLTDDVRSQLSFMDFADFLDTCRRAGLADTSATGTVTVRGADNARFRITLA
jgi:hypothetical protein